MIDAPSVKRRNHKWAMAGHKGGKCIGCGGRVTDGTIEDFHFDHVVQVNNHADKTDRWGGAIRDWPPFTDQWFAWAERVDLICSDCHIIRHQGSKQLSIDFEAQSRMDEAFPV